MTGEGPELSDPSQLHTALPPRTWEIRVDLLWCGCLEPYLTRLISSDIKTYLPHNLDDVWHCDTLIDR